MISKKKLMELYTAMVKCRVAAECASNAVPAGSTPAADTPIHEAILAGVIDDLKSGDTILHSSLGPAPKKMKDSPLDRVVLAIARNGHPHLAKKKSPEPDTLKAIGQAARASKEKKESIVVAFCDGVRARRSHWKKHLAQASRKNLPVLFVCPEHDLHASHRRQIAETDALLHGVPVIVVDGHDVVAVYRVASESIARARQRRGPTIIATAEFIPSTNSKPARRQSSVSPSLAAIEKHLKEQGLYRARKRPQIERTFRRNLQSAIRTRTR